MITIVDYGIGNLGSIQNMLAKVGADSVITSDPSRIECAHKLILPGVGTFDRAMTNLHDLGLIPILNEKVISKGTPILGICLGMQLFAKRSDEGVLPGLGWIDAETVRFDFTPDLAHLRLPHMGWNTLCSFQKRAIFSDAHESPRFYFVHSYHVRCNDQDNVLATTSYGIMFHSAVIKGNIVGTQFHPEKSHKYGIKLMKNFVEW